MGASSGAVARSLARRIAWGLLVLPTFALGLPPARGAEQTAVTIRLTADQATYGPGDVMTLTLRAVNETNHPVTLTFRTAQRFDFVVRDPAGQELWRWATGRMFAQVAGSETIPPSGTLLYTAQVDKKLVPGIYTAAGLVTAQEGNLGASLALRVEPR